MKTAQRMLYTCVLRINVMKRNNAVLNDLYTIEATDKIPDNCKHPLRGIQAAQN